jgi:predicted Zn-dependent peptidase
MPAVRSIAMGILADVGPRDEQPEQAGLAHLTEHLLFQGTSNRNARQMAAMMDLAGGQIGGFTARDYTCYFANVLDEHCTYAVDLLGDLLLNPTFPAEGLEREKAAILCEMEAARDSPGKRAHSRLKEAAWPRHPLGRPITGSPETVASLTREDVIYFFHKHYVPDRIIIAAAGHVEHGSFVAQVHDAFWRLLGKGEPVSFHPPGHQPGVVLEPVPVSQAYFSLGIPAYSYTHAGRYGLHVLNELVGGGISSRLFRRLREEQGLVYDIGSEYHAYRDAGMLAVEGSTSPEFLPVVLRQVLTELRGLAEGTAPVTEEELWKATGKIRRQHLLSDECTNTRMSRLATQEFYFGRHLTADEVLNEIEGVDGGSIHGLAGTYLLDALRHTTVAVVGPETPQYYDAAKIGELLVQD